MIRFFGKTDIGAKRQSNQDTFVCTVLCENASLGVVCDGMGGCNGGSVASQTAVSVFTNYLRLNFVPHIDDDNRLDPSDFSVTELLRSAGAAANEAVFSKSHEEEELSGMGTTLVAALQIDDCVYVANIGDSRLYLITDDEMVQITHDHSFVQYLVDIGEITPEEAEVNPNRNVITRAVGSEERTEPDIYFIDLAKEGPCRLLLCSDGLTNYLSTDAIFEIMRRHTPSEEKAEALISAAMEGGGGDNITVVIGDSEEESAEVTAHE